ncbi:MAG: GntR family transcriptional regulator, partial [Planctomycetes bacterium]|nr:GntR family transcriptional regulator [Planctomycetota bacterium]
RELRELLGVEGEPGGRAESGQKIERNNQESEGAASPLDNEDNSSIARRNIEKKGGKGRKQEAIKVLLRRKIVRGELRPGELLPRRVDLAEMLGTSNVTIQSVMDELIEDGFLRAVRGQGTFVADRGPHVSRYGVVVPGGECGEKRRYSQFWEAICVASRELAAATECEFPIFDTQDLSSEGKLDRDLRNDRLAGLIFADAPHAEGMSVFRKASLPTVAVVAESTSTEMPVVHLDMRGFMNRAVDHLADNGCQKLALLTARGSRGTREHLHQCTQKHQIAVRPYWVLSIDPWSTEAVITFVQLLMSNDKDRPDGIIIADDNLVPQATTGLRASGLRVAEDVQLIAYTNYPSPTTSHTPVTRLGIDAREVLKECILQIDLQRKGEPPAPATYVDPRFETEIHPEAQILSLQRNWGNEPEVVSM